MSFPAHHILKHGKFIKLSVTYAYIVTIQIFSLLCTIHFQLVSHSGFENIMLYY